MNKTQYSAMANAKCPRCREGKMFANTMYGFHLQKMNDCCPNCGFRFEREPGYFYAAMYVGYAMNVIELLLACTATYAWTGNLTSFALYMTVLSVFLVILSPFNYRYSRVILLFWLTPGIKYDPKK
jgi:uncharacterized protein (DUF983 family)